MRKKLLYFVVIVSCIIGCRQKSKYNHNGREYDQVYQIWDTTKEMSASVWVRDKDTAIEYDPMRPPPPDMVAQIDRRANERSQNKKSRKSN